MSLVQKEWKDRLYQYITGIVQHNKHKMIIINGMPDHLHIVVGMRPAQSVADQLQDIKANSSRWINKEKLVRGKFEWQEGYGAFSYSKSALPKLIEYVKNQQAHHQNKTFLQEYREFLNAFEIDYDDQYLFREID